MKISVSLTGADLKFIDAYRGDHGKDSRSEVLREAVRTLREQDLVAQYGQAFDEWASMGDDWAGTRERVLAEEWLAEKARDR